MTWIVERPLPILALGLVALAAMAGVFFHTGRRSALYGLIAVPMVCGALLLLERMIVTEREQVAAALHGLADVLQQNDLDAVLEYISPESVDLRREVESRLPMAVVHTATIKRNLEVTVSRTRNRPIAQASFNAVAIVSDKSGIINRQLFARYFVVYLRKEDGRWQVHRYEDYDPVRRR